VIVSANKFWHLVKKKSPRLHKTIINFYVRIKSSVGAKTSTKDVFTKIKNENLWGSPESVSGAGSEIKQAKMLIMELPKLFKEIGIKSILDIPCGDFNWMREIDLSNFNYTGGDIVDTLISENIKKYSSKNIKFMPINIISDTLPEMDLVFVRDCFVHLSFQDIKSAIINIKRSGCKYLMTTTFKDHHINHDIITGGWRPINLENEPFNFPEPEYTLVENCTERNGKQKDKSMGLWEIKKL